MWYEFLENKTFVVKNLIQFAEFQPADTVKKYFRGIFQAFYTRTRSIYSKAFICLKLLKIICEEVNSQENCEMSTCKFTSKTLSHILHVFCLRFLRTHHNYFFRKGFESVQAQFFFRKYMQKVVLLLIYMFNYDSSKSTFFMSLWHLLSWNSLFLAIQTLQEHPSFYSVCFDIYLFIKT